MGALGQTVALQRGQIAASRHRRDSKSLAELGYRHAPSTARQLGNSDPTRLGKRARVDLRSDAGTQWPRSSSCAMASSANDARSWSR
jgi:hypothetical protein